MPRPVVSSRDSRKIVLLRPRRISRGTRAHVFSRARSFTPAGASVGLSIKVLPLPRPVETTQNNGCDPSVSYKHAHRIEGPSAMHNAVPSTSAIWPAHSHLSDSILFVQPASGSLRSGSESGTFVTCVVIIYASHRGRRKYQDNPCDCRFRTHKCEEWLLTMLDTLELTAGTMVRPGIGFFTTWHTLCIW